MYDGEMQANLGLSGQASDFAALLSLLDECAALIFMDLPLGRLRAASDAAPAPELIVEGEASALHGDLAPMHEQLLGDMEDGAGLSGSAR